VVVAFGGIDAGDCAGVAFGGAGGADAVAACAAAARLAGEGPVLDAATDWGDETSDFGAGAGVSGQLSGRRCPPQPQYCGCGGAGAGCGLTATGTGT
jgi:hypothetical protein